MEGISLSWFCHQEVFGFDKQNDLEQLATIIQ